ncbi:MAG TPA: LuxR C-terminal-related transcriptional regulator [Amycolatopsis sp.]|nr:LuxR C-terminal-related transcriptional regulator [Amycolatopsis sp.]
MPIGEGNDAAKSEAAGNLPIETTSFVGRRREIGHAKELLTSARILTLTGPGGVGKTRLALRLAAQSRRAVRHGAWLIDLSDLRQGDLVPQAVTTALGIREETSDPRERLLRYLRDKQILLVFDNCEHLAEATAMLIAGLLAVAPRLRVIATSQHVLGIEGEQVLPVPPLPHDDEDPAAPGGDALALFEQRGKAADPGFRITDANREDAVAICRRLDGIPLALELAAVRVRAFSVAQIRRRLDDTMPLLTKGERSRPLRQRTLENTMRWSFDLCSRTEQQLWRRLAVFAGGFTLEAAEEICHGGLVGDVAEALSGLVDKSIVVRGNGTGGARYRLLEVVRQFGAARLADSGEKAELLARHCDYFRRHALRAYSDYCSERDIEWFTETFQELANIRAALEFSLSPAGDAHLALQISAAMTPFWEHERFLLEGYGWLRQSLERNNSASPERANALAFASFMGLLVGRVTEAGNALSECENLATELALDGVLASSALARAFLEFVSGDIGATLSGLAEAVRLGRASGNDWATAEALTGVSLLSFVEGDERAAEKAENQLRFAREKGTHLNKALALWLIGLNHWRDDDHDSAVRYMREALTLLERFPSSTSTATCIEGLAWAAASQGDMERAAELIGASREVWQANDMRLAQSITYRVGEKIEKTIRAALGADAFERAFNRGAGLSLEQATDLALGRRRPEDRRGKRVRGNTGLTKRELEIARLVASGLTNREIAGELLISTRTADSHVEHILRKLGFRSRTQIVAWASKHDAPDAECRPVDA